VKEKQKKPKKLTANQLRDLQITCNIGLVHRVAQQYKAFCNNTSVTYQDIVQEGIIGLIIARDRFKPSKNVRFSTYANYWIRAKILRHLDSSYSTMHITYSASATYSQLLKRYGTFGDMITDLIKKVSNDYATNKISYRDFQKFIMVLEAKAPLSHTHISLDKMSTSGDAEPFAGHGETTIDSRFGDKLKTVDKIEQILSKKSVINKMLDNLSEQEQKLIKMYYGLDSYEPHTYHELSKEFNCSKQRAHQWHKRITDRLRERIKQMCLDDSLAFTELLSEN
jgi:RNA polymerase primary sigma factor